MSTPRSSKLLEDLEAAIRAERRPAEKDRYRAQYIVQLARVDRVEEAATLLADLRLRNAAGNVPRLTPWINYADSMLDRRLGLGDSARIKMRRAQATSKVAGLADLQAMCSSQLAHIYWNGEEPEAAIRELRDAFRLSATSDHDTRYRANVVLGEMFAMSRREDLAVPCFVRARGHADASGDDVSRSMLSFNLAMTRVMMLRQMQLDKLQSSSPYEDGLRHVDASENLDALLGIRADASTLSLKAQAYSLLGQAQKSLEVYRNLFQQERVLPAKRRRADWYSDKAWCHVRLDDLLGAKRAAVEAEATIVAETQIDDRAAIASRLALVYAALGEPETAARHAEQAAILWAEYRQYQDRCVELCLTVSVDDELPVEPGPRAG